MTTLDPAGLAASDRIDALQRDGAAAHGRNASAIDPSSPDRAHRGLAAVATRARAELGHRLVALGHALEGEAGRDRRSVVARR
jgi:hypothetical protein